MNQPTDLSLWFLACEVYSSCPDGFMSRLMLATSSVVNSFRTNVPSSVVNSSRNSTNVIGSW